MSTVNFVQKLSIATAGVAIMALGTVGAAQASTITFDTFGGFGTTVTGNEWISDGIVFSTPDNRLGFGTTTGSQFNSLGAHQTNGDDFSGSIIGQFINNQFATDLKFLIFNTFNPVKAFDINGNLLTTISPIGSFDQIVDFSGFQVNRFETTGSLYAIDDVSYGSLQSSQPVPEPFTTGGSVVALTFGWLMKREQKAAA